MKINEQKRDGNKVIIEIEEEYKVFEGSVDKSLAEAAKEIKIQGFRAGKAPKEMVEKVVDKEYLKSRAAQGLISDLYPKIIEETKIEPVDFPSVEIVQQKKNKPFIFKLTIDVYPEVQLGKYKGLKVEKKPTDISDEEIMKVLANFRDRLAKSQPDNKEEVALDDEFAKKVSQHKTLDELKEEVRTGMTKERTAEAEADLKNKLIAAAGAEAKVDIPDGMINSEINIMIDELRSSLTQVNLTLEDYLKNLKKDEKSLKEDLRKSAEIRVKGKLVLRAVAEKEKIEVSTDEFDAELKNIAQQSNEDLEELKKRVSDGMRKFVDDYLLRKKALEFVLEKAKVEILKSKEAK